MILDSLQWSLLIVAIVFTATGVNTKIKKQKSKDSKKRLEGDASVPINKYPSLAEILYKGKHVCGGAIIHNRWVVTAITCMHTNHMAKPEKFKVRVGSNTPSEGTMYDVVLIIPHPKYKRRHDFANIALLQIEGAFNLTRTVKIATMDKDGLARKSIGYKKCSTAGRFIGHMDDDEDSLKELVMVPVTQKKCRKSCYALNSKICLKSKNGGEQHCFSDVGSPLYCRGLLVGITSVGAKVCHEDTAKPFTKIAYFYNWTQYHIYPKNVKNLCDLLVGLCFWRYF